MKYPFLGPLGQRSADLLGLSMRGAASISHFPEEVHNECFEQIADAMSNPHKPIQTPVKLYIFMCNQYCTSHFIERDYDQIRKNTAQYKININDDDYLPENERVHVELPKKEPFKKNQQQQTSVSAPRKPLASTLEKAKYLFPFSPPDRSKVCDITECIKLDGYIAAGIHGPAFSSVDAMHAFTEKANLRINEMIVNGEKYTLDLISMIDRMNIFIDWTIERHKDLRHIQDITSPDDAKQDALKAISEFTPKLLKPFSQNKSA